MAYTPQTWADGSTGGTPISAARLTHIESGVQAAAATADAALPTTTASATYIAVTEGPYPVSKAGAVGDGTTDDTAAFQAAANTVLASVSSGYKSGRLLIPRSTNRYSIRDTINLVPPGGGPQHFLAIEGQGALLQWDGAINKSMFYAKGWKNAPTSGLHIHAPAAATGLVVFDIDVTTDAPSTSGLKFSDIVIDGDTGSKIVGYRLGHSNGGIADVNGITWLDCMVQPTTPNSGHIGWLIEGANTLALKWIGSGGSNCDYTWTQDATHDPNGTGVSGSGSGSIWVGCLGSGNKIDWDFASAGVYKIVGGRLENGQRIMQALIGQSDNPTHISIDGLTVENYDPHTNMGDTILRLWSAGSLSLTDCKIGSFAVDPTSWNFLIDVNAGSHYASLNHTGGTFRSNTSTTDYFVLSSNAVLRREGVSHLTSANKIDALYSDVTDGTPWRQPVNPLAYDSTTGGAWTVTQDNTRWSSRELGSSGAQNDSVTYTVSLSAGTWALDLFHEAFSDVGIYTVKVDGTSVGTVDGYNASAVPTKSILSGIAVANSGKHTLTFSMATKNASASNYRARINDVVLRRTA